MSNHTNHRRGEKYRTEHGPRWENPDPGAGCNSTHVARARKGWKKIVRRWRRLFEKEEAEEAVDGVLRPRRAWRDRG